MLFCTEEPHAIMLPENAYIMQELVDIMAALAELDAVGASAPCMASLLHASTEFSRRLSSGEEMSTSTLCKVSSQSC